jgi:hypothetical protein
VPGRGNTAQKIILYKAMNKEIELWRGIVSCVLITALMFCTPFESLARTSINRSNVLESGTQIILRVNENFKADSKVEEGFISAIVDTDVYSTDDTRILITAGTPAYIEYSTIPNGSWGEAGRVCLTNATTKTIDNKRVSLRLSNCKSGGSRLGGVIVLTLLFFPLGLISGCMKGSMPKIQSGATFKASVLHNVTVE